MTDPRQRRIERQLRNGKVAVVTLSHRRTGYLYHSASRPGYCLVTHDELADTFDGPRTVSVWTRKRLFEEGVQVVDPPEVPGPVAALARAR